MLLEYAQNQVLMPKNKHVLIGFVLQNMKIQSFWLCLLFTITFVSCATSSLTTSKMYYIMHMSSGVQIPFAEIL